MQSIIPAERQVPIFSSLVQQTLNMYYVDAEVSLVFHSFSLKSNNSKSNTTLEKESWQM